MTEQTNINKTSPEIIYLIINEYDDPATHFSQLTEVSWCTEKIDDNSIPYVRTGSAKIWYDRYLAAREKHHDRVSQLVSQIEDLKKRLQEVRDAVSRPN